MENNETSTNTDNIKIARVGRGRYMHSITQILDSSGKVIHNIVKPLMVELRPRDIMQIIVGATILAIPMAFTEETWKLGETLPLLNIIILAVLSFIFIAMFVYFNFYRFYLKDYKFEFVKRVLGIYLLSLLVVGLLMTVIEQCPWGADNLLALKRIIIVTFPASMSAAVTDSIK